MKAILLQEAPALDWENWRMFLEKKLKFPINVQSRGKMEFKKGEKLKITKLAGYNEKVGLIVDVKYRNQLGTYPLFDLMPVAKDKDLRQIFNDYLIWVTDTYHL